MSAATKKPKCAAPTSDGACLAPATQRVVKTSLVTHRCRKHRVAKLAAKKNGWRLFDVEASS